MVVRSAAGRDSVGISNNEAKDTEATSSPQFESEKRAGERERGWRGGGNMLAGQASWIHDLRFSTHALMLPPPKPTFLIPI